MLLKTNQVWKILLTHTAIIGESLTVHLHVALQVCKLTEGFPAIGAAVASHLRVTLQFPRVCKCFETESAIQEVGRMSFLVVEKGPGVSV